MPPPSPAPGWANGDVWSERTARRRTTRATLSSRRTFPVPRWFSARRGVFGSELLIEADQRVLVLVGKVGVPPDERHQVYVAGRVEDAGPHVQLLDGPVEGPGDLLEDLGG